MLRLFTLFATSLFLPLLCFAQEPLLLGSSSAPSPQIDKITALLASQLGQQVQLVALPAEGQVDLQLREDPPVTAGGGRAEFVGLLPTAEGRLLYLYRTSSRTARGQLEQAVSRWQQPYLPGNSQPAALQSVDEAVAAARNGHYSQALTFLYPYLEQNHRDARAHAETLVVLEWARRYQDAVILALSRPDLALPLYASKSVLRSVRASGWYADAEQFLLPALQHAPEDAELLSLQVHLLADQGRLADAEKLIEAALQQRPDYADFWLAKYYLQVLQQQTYPALDAIQRAYALVPSRYARRELIYSLERCGMPQQALLLLQDDPDVLTADEQFRLRRSLNAMQVRWGVFEQATLAQHYSETDAALVTNDLLLDELPHTELQQEDIHQNVLVFDRMVALRDRRQMRQVIVQWQALVEAEVQIPDYALQAVADALLYLQRPWEAAELYAAISQRNPNNASAWLGLYYSLHESNRYTEATELINRLVRGQALWNQAKGYRSPEGNPVRFRFELAAALDRLYRNEAELAEQQLLPLYHRGSHNTDLRKALGELANARHHPRQAQQLFQQGLAIAPQHSGLQAALADSFMVRRQWRLAEQSISRLGELFPDEGSTLRLQDEWSRHNMRILEGRISFGQGDSPNVDGQEIDWLLRQWTQPLDYDWRLAALAWNRQADLPEGAASRVYFGVAAQRQTPDLELFTQLALADTFEERWLAEFSGRYELNDSWAVDFGVAHNGAAVSLRALETGSSGTEYRLGTEWWRDESLSAAMQVALLDYSDGNLRSGLSLALRKRLLTGPRFQLENILRVAASRNSQPGGAYFAPDSDFMLEDELQARWISWRWYANTLTQRFSLASGGYWQQDHGWSLPLSFGYAHEWELRQRRLFVEYGSSLTRRHYDGVAENNLGLYLAFSWRY